MQKIIINRKGFTVVELLIVIVIIGILATLTIISYSGVREDARNAKILSDINQVNKLIGIYYAKNGSYPATGSAMDITNPGLNDNNCAYGSTRKTVDWVPGLNTTLPQSDGNPAGGAVQAGNPPSRFGCYVYISDGISYVLTAWNMLSAPQTSNLYRRLGSKESTGSYVCNHTNIGGNRDGTYDITEDYYKYSYTHTNITNCNETPPAGA